MTPANESLNDITEIIIGCAYRVSNGLGIGFLEKVYENALAHELRKGGLNVVQQYPATVYYDGVEVGHYVLDMLVNGAVVVELKAVKELDKAFLAQCLNYLKATNHRLCLLLNFGCPRLEIRRIVWDK